VELVCDFPGTEGAGTSLTKRLRFARDGSFRVDYRWDKSLGTPADLFAVELSLFGSLEVRADPPAERWTYPIETVAKSERGFDRTRQGDSLTLRWKMDVGAATVEVDPGQQSFAAGREAEASAGSAK
jgi:hypothetical protein